MLAMQQTYLCGIMTKVRKTLPRSLSRLYLYYGKPVPHAPSIHHLTLLFHCFTHLLLQFTGKQFNGSDYIMLGGFDGITTGMSAGLNVKMNQVRIFRCRSRVLCKSRSLPRSHFPTFPRFLDCPTPPLPNVPIPCNLPACCFRRWSKALPTTPPSAAAPPPPMASPTPPITWSLPCLWGSSNPTQ